MTHSHSSASLSVRYIVQLVAQIARMCSFRIFILVNKELPERNYVVDIGNHVVRATSAQNR